MSELLLAEHDYQVRDLVKRGFKDRGKWIALGPSAMACLDSLKIGYEIPEDLYSSDELEEFCRKTHRHVERLCDRLDGLVLDFCPELKSRGLSPFWFHIVQMMQIFDAVCSKVFQLQRILTAYPTYTVHVHKGRDFPWKPNDFFFSNNETLWGRVASLAGWNARIEILPDPDVSEDKISPQPGGSSIKPNYRKHILKSLWLTSAARFWMLGNYRGLLKMMRTDREVLLLVNAPYEWAQVLSSLNKDRRRILFVSEEYFAHKMENRDISLDPQGNFEQLESDIDLMNCFRLRGINYYPLLKDRLSWIWETSPQQFKWVARKVAELKRRYKIAGLLRCSSSSGIDHAINQSARALGIPVLAWQHGAVAHQERITQFRDYADSMTSDYTLVYGREVAKAYTDYGRQFSAKVISVGAPNLDSMSLGSQSAHRSFPNPKSVGYKKRVLYATTNYIENHWYSGFSPPFSDRQFFRDQSVIVSCLRMLAESEAVEVVVKLHPSYDYHEPPWVSELGAVRNIRIVKDEQSFADLLRETDIAVLDFPSTTLLQALAAGLPVFVLTSHLRYPRETEAMLSRRAVVAHDARTVIGEVQKFVGSGVYPADLSDTLFLEGYGTHLNDGKSGERAFELVSRVTANGLPDQRLRA
jgi:hypothetical protein